MPVDEPTLAPSEAAARSRKTTRRRFLLSGSAPAAAGLWGKILYDSDERSQRSAVFIAKADSYDDNLEKKVRETGFRS